jgi:signal transduction histidine kinase
MILDRGFLAKMSLRWRLAMVIMAAILAAVAFNMASLAVFDLTYFKQSLDDNLNVDSSVLAAQMEAPLDFDDSAAATQTLAAYGGEKHIRRILALRPDMSLFAEFHTPATKSLPALALTGKPPGPIPADDGLGYLTPVTGKGRPLGWVYMESDLSEIRQRYRWYALIAPAALALLAPVAFLLSVAFMRVTLRPILDLSETARAIASRRDYSRRAKGGGSQEIGELTDAFNQMLEQIEERDAKLAHHAGELEKAVHEATAALVEANARLAGELKERIAISEKLAKTGERLRAALEQAAGATVLKDNFVAMVSHDLKSPLAVIKGLSDGIADPSAAGETKVRDRVARIQRASEGALRLIDTLLDVNRLKTGKIILQKVRIKARAFVAAQIESIQSLAEQKNISLVNETPEDVEMFVDPGLYARVIGNLLSNAIKFSMPGGAVTVFIPEGSRSLAVRDSGVGIDPRIAPHLLTGSRKTTLGTAGEKGTGLGLFHSGEIVRAHGGFLSFRSEPGKGSVFIATLPSKETSCVLLVDDQPAHRAMMREQFALATTLPVIEAENGAEALMVLETVRPALIVIDVNMPVMGGLELIARLRQSPTLRDIPLVVATSTPGGEGGMEESELRKSLEALGVKDILQKPAIASEISELLAKLMLSGGGQPAGG